jgi:hypothetical protein
MAVALTLLIQLLLTVTRWVVAVPKVVTEREGQPYTDIMQNMVVVEVLEDSKQTTAARRYMVRAAAAGLVKVVPVMAALEVRGVVIPQAAVEQAPQVEMQLLELPEVMAVAMEEEQGEIMGVLVKMVAHQAVEAVEDIAILGAIKVVMEPEAKLESLVGR